MQNAVTKIILIGASTGGPGVIERLISDLPHDYRYPICIVQHFPPELTHSFITQLQGLTPLQVLESYQGLELRSGMIVVARGGEHMGFSKTIAGNIIIRQFAPSEGMRSDFVPSVDMMFTSASEIFRAGSALAVLLTGIGDDGVEGMANIAMSGGNTVCQDEDSSAVFGMPGRAIERGVVRSVLSPEAIRNKIIQFGIS